MARGIDVYYIFLIAVSVFFTALIYFLCAYFGVKYRRRHPDEVPAKPLKESLFLEIIWAGVPFVLVMIMFVWSAVIFFQAYHPPQGAMEMYVVGKQWMWKVQHPEGHREINEMHVPLGRPVKLTMTTEDVLHSYFIPAFRLKKDVVPGKYTSMWFEANKVGKFHLFCAEYCGNQHSGMIGTVHVMEPADYEAWLAGVQRGETMAQAGERLFSRLGCASCHKEDNTGRCPTLKEVFNKPVLMHNGQRVVADEAYLRESILKPNAKIVAGYTQIEMPTFQGQISEDGVLQIIAYLKTLSKPEPKQQAAAGVPAAAPKGGKK